MLETPFEARYTPDMPVEIPEVLTEEDNDTDPPITGDIPAPEKRLVSPSLGNVTEYSFIGKDSAHEKRLKKPERNTTYSVIKKPVSTPPSPAK